MNRDLLFKIVQLMGLLGSDFDNEVIGAARAIGRLLRAHDMSFGHLKLILREAIDPLEHMSSDTLIRIYVRELRESAGYQMMASHERRFIRDINLRLQLDPYLRLSDRQETWFYYLFSKYAA